MFHLSKRAETVKVPIIDFKDETVENENSSFIVWGQDPPSETLPEDIRSHLRWRQQRELKMRKVDC